MGGRLRLVTDQGVAIAAPSGALSQHSQRRDPPTQRGLPRVLQAAPSELRVGVNDRNHHAVRALRASYGIPLTEATLEFDAGLAAELHAAERRAPEERRTVPIAEIRPRTPAPVPPPPRPVALTARPAAPAEPMLPLPNRHPDLDLGRARHADPTHTSALVELSELNARRWPVWTALGLSAAVVAALAAVFFG